MGLCISKMYLSKKKRKEKNALSWKDHQTPHGVELLFVVSRVSAFVVLYHRMYNKKNCTDIFVEHKTALEKNVAFFIQFFPK